MLKKLSTQGHSLSLVIDRGLARVLDLNRDSYVRLTVHDKLLTIERVGQHERVEPPKPRPKPPVTRPSRMRELPTIVLTMITRLKLPPELFARLHHQKPPPTLAEWGKVVKAVAA